MFRKCSARKLQVINVLERGKGCRDHGSMDSSDAV